jgi:alpha-ketoglutarate-dependent taurine dioxygenase
VPSLLPELDAGIVPTRTPDPAEAARLMATDGACILTGLPIGRASAAGLARLVLGTRIVAAPEPVMVREGGDKDPKIRAEAAHEVPLPMHIDGFTYGHDCPDAMFLLCDRDSAEGGESVLVDDLLVLDALRSEPAGSAGAHLLAFVTDTELDLSSPGMVRRSGTMLRTSPSGRTLFWLGALRDCVGPLADDPDPAGTQARIDEVNELFESLRSRAPRFRLAPGEAVCVDNYRVSHSRDGYVDLDRLFWRVWGWTDDAIGVPEGRLASDVRYAGT